MICTVAVAFVLVAVGSWELAEAAGKALSYGNRIGKVRGSEGLIRAVLSGNYELVKDLLCSGEDPNSVIIEILPPDNCLKPPQRVNITLLMLAASIGNTKISEILLCKGADSRATTSVGSRPLTAGELARSRGHADLASMLDSGSAPETCPDCKEQPSGTPSDTDVKHIPYDIHSDCPPEEPCKEPGSHPEYNQYLIKAVRTKGCPSKNIDCYLCLGADPNAITQHIAYQDVTLLNQAAWQCSEHCVAILLGENQYNTKPAEVNPQSEEGETALHFAATCRYDAAKCTATAAKLLQHGTNPNVQNWNGVTALMTAIRSGCSPEFIKLLLENGADPKLEDKQGHSAMWYAKDKPEIQALLQQYGGKK